MLILLAWLRNGFKSGVKIRFLIRVRGLVRMVRVRVCECGGARWFQFPQVPLCGFHLHGFCMGTPASSQSRTVGQ